MEVSTIKFRENLIQQLLRNLDLKFGQNLQSEKSSNSVKFQISKNAGLILMSRPLKQAIIRPNRRTLSKVMNDFVCAIFPRKAKNEHY
jgi:hypothetical protein